MIDSDLVRVDLLKVKRKIYNSYPEGSVERSNFLMASKLSEIGYLSKMVPSDVVNTVLSEYHLKVKQELVDFGINLILALGWGLLFHSFHMLSPKTIVFSFWYVPSGLFILNGGKHIWNLIDSWRIMRNFKKEYKIIKDQIKKLSDEVKRIGDGK